MTELRSGMGQLHVMDAGVTADEPISDGTLTVTSTKDVWNS